MNRPLSLYLDFLRVGAALVVLVTHLAYVELSGGMLAPWRLYGNDAVMLFFVLSGFVIAYVAEQKERDARDYALSRLARLWSVAVPALLLTILLDQWGRSPDPAAYRSWWYAGEAPASRILAALTFTNELWFASTRPFSNGPYWSLGYEAVYYALFGALFYLRGRRRLLAAALVCLLAGPKILLLFPIWWLGVLAYRRTRRGPLPPRLGLVLFAGSILGYAAFRWSGLPVAFLAETRALLGAGNVAHYLHFSDEFVSSYVIGPLVAAHFLGAHALSHRIGKAFAPVAGFVRWIAQYTFTIYLLHYPLLRFLGAALPYDRQSPLHVAGIFLVTVAACVAVGAAAERHKGRLRALLAALAAPRRSTATAPATAERPLPLH